MNSKDIMNTYDSIRKEDDERTKELKYGLRVMMEKDHKQYSFIKFLKQVLSCLKVIEHEKE
jgi:hypothetical protein